MTPDTPTAAPAPSRAEKINRAIAEKCLGCAVKESTFYAGEFWGEGVNRCYEAPDGKTYPLNYSPMTDAAQADERQTFVFRHAPVAR